MLGHTFVFRSVGISAHCVPWDSVEVDSSTNKALLGNMTDKCPERLMPMALSGDEA